MTLGLSPVEAAKYAAASRAAAIVEDGMKVGLGTGSTAAAWATTPFRAEMRSISAILCTVLAPVAFGFLHVPMMPMGRTSLAFIPRHIVHCPKTTLGATEGKEGGNGVMSSNWLSHAMLRVPDVNATVDCWLNRGATLSSYRKAGQSETAFVTMAARSFSVGSAMSKRAQKPSSSLGTLTW